MVADAPRIAPEGGLGVLLPRPGRAAAGPKDGPVLPLLGRPPVAKEPRSRPRTSETLRLHLEDGEQGHGDAPKEGRRPSGA